MARGIILLAIFCLFFVRVLGEIHDFEQVYRIPEDQRVVVTGRICKKEFKGEDGVYYLKNANVKSQEDGPEVVLKRMIVRVPTTEFLVGDTIEATCNMRWMEEASNKGGFDERDYYHSLGVSTLLYCDQALQVQEKRRICPVRNGLSHLRARMRLVYVEMLNEKDAGILSSMVLGDKSLMEDGLKQLYSSAGISHILAVSGLHVSIVGMTLFRFLRKRKCKYGMCCIVSGLVLLMFCIMSGMSVSAIRAGIMFLLFLGAQFLGRKYHSVRGLLVAAVISLIANPSYCYNAGFLFSYFAVFGAVAVAPIFVETIRFENETGAIKKAIYDMCQKKIINSLSQSMILSGSILMTTLPLTAYFYFEIPVYSIFANLIVIPLAGVLMGFGLIGGLVGCFVPVWILFLPCHWILRLYEWVCEGLRLLPVDVWITGRPSLWMMIIYYGGIVFFVWFYKYKSRIRMEGRLIHLLRNKTLFLVLVLWMIVMFVIPPAKQFQISFLDVGQGDGIYINGGDGKQYFVDGGSTSQKELGRYTILPFLKYHRVRHIDMWFVSHADTDHISGLLEVLDKGYDVETIVISALAPDDENLLMLRQAAKENKTEIVFVENGAYIQGQEYRIVCYTPAMDEAGDRNQASLVNLIDVENGKSKNGFRILLTGDIGEAQEEWLIQQDGIGDVDILKAAHHGSKYSNSSSFLEAVAPEATIISCGENNLYGHPHKETIERLESVGSDIWLTMDVGEITLR